MSSLSDMISLQMKHSIMLTFVFSHAAVEHCRSVT